MKNPIINCFALIIMVASILPSCSDRIEVITPKTGEQPIAIRPLPSIATKAPIAGNVFPNDRTITLSAYHNSEYTQSSNFFSGIKFENSGDVWTSGKYWPLNGSLDLLAYSADGLNVTAEYGENVADSVTLVVPDNSIAQTDILWAGAEEQTFQSSGNAMVFKHALASIGFTAKSNLAYDPVSNTGITITGIKVSALSSGKAVLRRDMSCSWSELSDSTDIVLPGLDEGYDVTTTTESHDSSPYGLGEVGVLVIPQEAKSFSVIYTLHYGRDTTGAVINKVGETNVCKCTGKWEAGKKYIYKLDMTLDEIIVSSTILEWTLDEEGVPVAEPVSAYYNVSGDEKVYLPAATIEPGSVVSVDWGDGCNEIFNAAAAYTTKSSLGDTTLRMDHVYNSTFRGAVKIHVRRGKITFGRVSINTRNRFTINDNAKVEVTIREGGGELSLIDSMGADMEEMSTANCYVIRQPGFYTLPLVYGNGIKEGEVNAAAYTNIAGTNCADFVNHLGNVITSPYIEENEGCTASSAELVWQTASDLVDEISLIEKGDLKYIEVGVNNIPSENGIALVCVKDASGEIMWSWMLWCTNDDLSAEIYTNHDGINYSLMRENLGAIWNEARTMYYNPHFQWGRKDPMAPLNGEGGQCMLFDIFGETYTGFGILGTGNDQNAEKTVANAIRKPNYFFTYYNTSSYSWNNLKRFNNFWNAAKNADDLVNDQDSAVKTIYDPCPYGWMLPSGPAFTGFTTTGQNSSTKAQFNIIGNFSKGWTFKKNEDDSIGSFYPASGCRGIASGGLAGVGSDGYCWTYSSDSQSYARYLSFGSSNVYPLYNNYRAYGFSVRPCQEF